MKTLPMERWSREVLKDGEVRLENRATLHKFSTSYPVIQSTRVFDLAPGCEGLQGPIGKNFGLRDVHGPGLTPERGQGLPSYE